MRSANYSEHPIIWSNDLGEEIDRKILVNGIRVGFKLAYSSVLKPYNIRLIDEPVSACSKFEYMSDDYWNCSIQHNTRTENHQAGTCKMGPKSDKFAVVNNKLQVHGIKGLRVADASIMPQVRSICVYFIYRLKATRLTISSRQHRNEILVQLNLAEIFHAVCFRSWREILRLLLQ